MDLTPQSMRSPVSPFDDNSKHSFEAMRASFAPAPQAGHSSMEESTQGLGIFGVVQSQEHIISDMPPSPRQSPLLHHAFYPSSSSAPNITTSAFDPFSGFDNATGADLMSAHEETPDLVYCHSPPSSNMASHRSSIASSCSPPPQQQGFYTPRVKSEDLHEWYPSIGNEGVLQRSLSHQSYSPYSTTVTTIHGTTEDLFKGPAMDWSKGGSLPYDSMAPRDHKQPRVNAIPVLSNAHRIKKKRQRTTPEEATHDCHVCGKLFKRSYNWKSHMETHNPDRKYPHPCTATVDDQPCTKKFQRKTDLDRHFESVHLKTRNHQCDLCGHRFARRDTLRRHTEDGCPKRFEVTPPTPASRWAPTPSRSFSTPNAVSSMPPPPSTPSMQHPASAHPSSQPYFPRPEYAQSPLQSLPQGIFA